MKGFRIGSTWWWRRLDGNATEVTVTKSLKTKIKVRADISGWAWETRDTARLSKRLARKEDA